MEFAYYNVSIFTVYGPWAVPIWQYTSLFPMPEGRSIDTYNNGEMFRDFTYIDDLANALGF